MSQRALGNLAGLRGAESPTREIAEIVAFDKGVPWASIPDSREFLKEAIDEYNSYSPVYALRLSDLESHKFRPPDLTQTGTQHTRK